MLVTAQRNVGAGVLAQALAKGALRGNELDRSLQLAAGSVNVAPSWTADECGYARRHEYLLKVRHSILGWRLKRNSWPRVERNQVYLSSYSADQFAELACIRLGIIYAVEENIFEGQPLPVSQREITRRRHQLF